MTTTRALPVLIIGGGFSGSMLAARLAEKGKASVVIEKNGPPGLGVAYSTTQDAHRLNVRTSNMGALADDPGHFQKWLAQNHPDRSAPEGYAPRRLYGAYVRDRLKAVDHRHPGLIEWVAAEAMTIDGNSVILDNGLRLTGSAIVMASGNPPPRAPSKTDSPRRLSDPWATGALEKIGALDNILILGTGLTMVDVLLSLDAAGWQGKATALSRRGLAPRAHIYGHHAPARLPRTAVEGPLSHRLKAVRQLARQTDWRDIMDAYRPLTAELWAAASNSRRATFLRHLRPWWDVHRHRIAPEIADHLQKLQDEGRLHIKAGRIASVTSDTHGLDINWLPRGTNSLQQENVQWLIDCTGPGHDPAHDPLTAPLIKSGRLCVDDLGLGLRVASTGQAIAKDGSVDPVIHVLGPPARAAFWETIAVPDIRQRIEQLSERLR